MEKTTVIDLLESLAGEPCMQRGKTGELDTFFSSSEIKIGCSQFNEILIFLGYDRICPELFDYLCIGELNTEADSSLNTLDQLREGVDRFRTIALFAFGNIKYGYKRLATDADLLKQTIDLLTPITDGRYRNRLPPAIRIKDIPAEDRYFLGYVVEQELKRKLKDNPDDEDAKAGLKKRADLVAIGVDNQTAFLTSDYLDVYVATSMRERHEYRAVAALAKEVFRKPELRDLNVRWFDPTLAYCGDRIDKGLSEALMLKRAKCTLFLAQESDTLGKDSELACTLAQGKPVIAYVPVGDRAYIHSMLSLLESTYPGRSRNDLILEQLKYFGPTLAWSDPKVRKWLDDPSVADLQQLEPYFEAVVKSHYDKRAEILKTSHPLGIQVHLGTGVAVGVLVVRDLDTCAKLIARILVGDYRLKLSKELSADGSATHWTLREELSSSIFRVMTEDKILTNAFWNWYLR